MSEKASAEHGMATDEQVEAAERRILSIDELRGYREILIDRSHERDCRSDYFEWLTTATVGEIWAWAVILADSIEQERAEEYLARDAWAAEEQERETRRAKYGPLPDGWS